MRVDGKVYQVEVAASGELETINQKPVANKASDTTTGSSPQTEHSAGTAHTIEAPLSGNVFKLMISEGDEIQDGDVVMILEAMKMETEVRSAYNGTVSRILAKEGDAVTSGQSMIELS